MPWAHLFTINNVDVQKPKAAIIMPHKDYRPRMIYIEDTSEKREKTLELE